MTVEKLLERIEDLIIDLTDHERSQDPDCEDMYGDDFEPMGVCYYRRETEGIKEDLEMLLTEQRKRRDIAMTRAELAISLDDGE